MRLYIYIEPLGKSPEVHSPGIIRADGDSSEIDRRLGRGAATPPRGRERRRRAGREAREAREAAGLQEDGAERVQQSDLGDPKNSNEICYITNNNRMLLYN